MGKWQSPEHGQRLLLLSSGWWHLICHPAVLRFTHLVPLPPWWVGEKRSMFWCHINFSVLASSAARCSTRAGRGNGERLLSLFLSLRLPENLLQFHTKPALLPKPPVESSRSALELLGVHPTPRVPSGDSCPSSGDSLTPFHTWFCPKQLLWEAGAESGFICL